MLCMYVDIEGGKLYAGKERILYLARTYQDQAVGTYLLERKIDEMGMTHCA
jgi:hypothetical protein